MYVLLSNHGYKQADWKSNCPRWGYSPELRDTFLEYDEAVWYAKGCVATGEIHGFRVFPDARAVDKEPTSA